MPSTTTILPLFYLSFMCIACQDAPTRTENTTLVDSTSIPHKDTLVPPAVVERVDTIAPSSLASYLEQLEQYPPLQGTNLSNRSEASNRDKYQFSHKDNWHSIQINEDEVTKTAIYEVTDNGTQLRYIALEPAIEIDGAFVNYYQKPAYKYYYQNNQLVSISYHNPKNQQATDPKGTLEDSTRLLLGDSLKNQLERYFHLDNSTLNVAGAWNHPESSMEYSFETNLQQRGNFIWGSYCAYTTSKHDCSNEEQGGDPCFVEGYVYGDTLHLKFHSCYAGTIGTARVYAHQDALIWKTIYAPRGSLTPDSLALDKTLIIKE